LGNGKGCSSAGECTSGHCVAQICCNDACNDPCMSCSGALTGGMDGVCAALKLRTQACVAGAFCLDDVTLQPPGANSRSCVPYRSAGADCLSQCNSIDDCAAGYVCDEKRACVRRDSAETDDTSCGCRTPRRDREPFGLIWLVFAAG